MLRLGDKPGIHNRFTVVLLFFAIAVVKHCSILQEIQLRLETSTKMSFVIAMYWGIQ